MTHKLSEQSFLDIQASKEFHLARQLLLANNVVVPNFPEPGVQFVELLGMLYHHPHVLGCVTKVFNQWIKESKADCLAVIDARGFIFGAPVAAVAEIPLVILRKQGKLPPPTRSVSYASEYAGAALTILEEIDLTGKRVAIIDDILATGGTALAALDLLKEAGAHSVSAGFVGEIAPLGGRNKLQGVDTFVIVSFLSDT